MTTTIIYGGVFLVCLLGVLVGRWLLVDDDAPPCEENDHAD